MMKVSAKKLRDLMVKNGLGVTDLALHSKVSTTTISRMMKEDSPATVPTITKLANAFGIDYHDLLA